MDIQQSFESLKKYIEKFPEPLLITIEIIVIVVLAILAASIGSFIIKKTLKKNKSLRYGVESKKLKTMVTLLVSVYKYAIYIIAFVIILSEVFKVKSILATAGIGGIALGLGAQSLIKDIISGFFIVMEDQFVIGDIISVDNMTGTVEELELRVTRLRNVNGDLYIIPNGEIKRITNHTRGNKAIIVDIPVSYSSDIKKAIEIIKEVCSKVCEEFTTITEAPSVLGITDLGKEMLNIRVMGKALPNEQGFVERRIRLLIKEEFDKADMILNDRIRIYSKEDVI